MTDFPPSVSEMSAACTSSTSNRPPVSTITCRLRPVTFFPPIEAAVPAGFGRLRGLAVQHRRARLGRTPLAFPIRPPQQVIHAPPGPVILPLLEVVVDGRPFREIVRQEAPGAAGPVQIEERVRHFADIHPRRRARTAGFPLQVRLHDFPLLVRQVARIALPDTVTLHLARLSRVFRQMLHPSSRITQHPLRPAAERGATYPGGDSGVGGTAP